MQVNLTSSAGPARSADDNRHLLLPELLELLGAATTTQARHQRQAQQHERDLREKDADYREAVAEASSGNRPADQIARAERKMLPGSKAARRELLRDKAAQRGEARGDFQRALSDASGRGKANQASPTGRRPNEAAPGAESQDTVVLQEGSGKPAKPTPDTAPQATAAGAAKTVAGNTAAALPAAQFASPAASGSSALLQEISAATRSEILTGRASGVSAAAGAKVNAVVATAKSSGGSPTATITGAESQSVRPGKAGKAAKTELPGLRDTGKTDANIERIVRLLRLRIGKERSVATLRLDPPELGTVRLHMDLQNNRLMLRVHTQTVAAQRLLDDQIETLRRNLEVSGVHLERVEIRAPESPSSPPEAHSQQHGVLGDQQEQSAHSDGESAGGGQDWESESPTVEPTHDDVRDGPRGPAAESLVNVLA